MFVLDCYKLIFSAVLICDSDFAQADIKKV